MFFNTITVERNTL